MGMLGYVFLIDDLCGEAQLTVSDPDPGQMVQGSIRKQPKSQGAN